MMRFSAVCCLLLGAACAPPEIARVEWSSTTDDGGIDGAKALEAQPTSISTLPSQRNLCGCGYWDDAMGGWRQLPQPLCNPGKPAQRRTVCANTSDGTIESARCGPLPTCMPLEVVQVLPSNVHEGSCAGRTPCEDFSYVGTVMTPTSCTPQTRIVDIGTNGDLIYQTVCEEAEHVLRWADVAVGCEEREMVTPAVPAEDGVEVEPFACVHLTDEDGQPKIDPRTGEVQCSSSCPASTVLAAGGCRERIPIPWAECMPRSRFPDYDGETPALDVEARPGS